jgi:hypothetical protein
LAQCRAGPLRQPLLRQTSELTKIAEVDTEICAIYIVHVSFWPVRRKGARAQAETCVSSAPALLTNFTYFTTGPPFRKTELVATKRAFRGAPFLRVTRAASDVLTVAWLNVVVVER